MRTIKNLMWALLPIFALTFVVGCEKGPKEEPQGPQVVKDSVIKLSANKVEASLAGGEYTMIYEIENAHAGEKITAEAAESWVNNFNTGVSGILYFKVDANNSDKARECLVTVKYRYAEDVVFVVKQGAKVSASFTLENVTSDYFSYTVDVIPDNKTQPYIVMSADPKYIAASGFESGEDFYEDDVAYFGWLGQFYGQSAAQVMQERSKIGDQRGINPGKGAAGIPYTFYCYYIDYESGALLSEVAFFEVKTKSPEKIAADFDVEYSVDGCVVHANVTPKDGFNGAYYFDVLNGLMVDDYLASFDFLENEGDVAEFYWSFAVQDMMFNGNMNGQTIVDMYNCQGTYEDGTPRSEFDFELLANHTYYLFAFAMEENGLCCSEPKIVKIETGSVPMSDNVITPSVSKITVQTAHISFKTTNNDYYIAGWEKASDWATYGNTDAERQKYLLENLSYEFIQGDYEQNVIGLEGGTDYILYAFGSRGGIATTAQIFTCPFSTKSTDAGNATIEYVDNGYYAAEDLAELPGWEFFGGDYYSGTFILPLEYHIEGEWQAFYSNIYNWTGRYDLYNDTQYRDGLVWSIDQYGSMNLDKSYSILQNDSFYIIASLVIDTEGQYSEISKFEVRTSYDGARTDASEFDEWWNGTGASLSSVVISDEQPKELFRTKTAHDNKLSKQGFEVKSSRMNF
ncbi:MAG: hypothetical protein J6Q62_06135 [Alistipes sp.]|nr:hypothetical protein [Alistipes sp.]